MQQRLIQLGMRPINSIVDISNYVMLELGQPNHTFDLATIPDGRLNIRRARDGETLVTLDDIERSLVPNDGVITDESDTIISLAGVMGAPRPRSPIPRPRCCWRWRGGIRRRSPAP